VESLFVSRQFVTIVLHGHPCCHFARSWHLMTLTLCSDTLQWHFARLCHSIFFDFSYTSVLRQISLIVIVFLIEGWHSTSRVVVNNDDVTNLVLINLHMHDVMRASLQFVRSNELSWHFVTDVTSLMYPSYVTSLVTIVASLVLSWTWGHVETYSYEAFVCRWIIKLSASPVRACARLFRLRHRNLCTSCTVVVHSLHWASFCTEIRLRSSRELCFFGAYIHALIRLRLWPSTVGQWLSTIRLRALSLGAINYVRASTTVRTCEATSVQRRRFALFVEGYITSLHHIITSHHYITSNILHH
jgi:hypothetical protein